MSVPGLALDLLTDFQLQIEHALDLAGRDLAVIVDAALVGPEPFDFTPVRADLGATLTTHAMSPGALLRVCRQIAAAPPPDCRLLAIRGYGFELGEGLSPRAQTNLNAAEAFLLGWLASESSPQDTDTRR